MSEQMIIKILLLRKVLATNVALEGFDPHVDDSELGGGEKRKKKN